MRLVGPLLALAACAGQLPPQVVSRQGAAIDHPIRRIVAVTPTCSQITSPTLGPNAQPMPATECAAADTADVRVRSELAFRGFEVIDAELVNVVTARHHEVIVEQNDRVVSSTREVIGARFTDATPLEQAAILGDLNADALLMTRILLTEGEEHLDHVDLQLEMRTAAGQRLVWGRRCSLDVPLTSSLDRTIETAVRCALESR